MIQNDPGLGVGGIFWSKHKVASERPPSSPVAPSVRSSKNPSF